MGPPTLFALGLLLVLVGLIAEDGGGLDMGIPMLVVAVLVLFLRKLPKLPGMPL